MYVMCVVCVMFAIEVWNVWVYTCVYVYKCICMYSYMHEEVARMNNIGMNNII